MPIIRMLIARPLAAMSVLLRRLRPQAGPDAGRASPSFPSASSLFTPRSLAALDADGALVEQYLQVVRNALRAGHASVWRVTGRDATALCCHTAGDASPSQRLDAFVRLAAAERRVHVDAHSRPPVAAMALPSSGEGEPFVLLVIAEQGSTMSADVQRELPPAAAMLAALLALLDTRRSATRQARATSALLAAAREFQRCDTSEELATAVCRACDAVVDAARAALVRFPPGGQGRIEAVHGEGWLEPGAAIDADSMVYRAFAEAIPLCWSDASALGATALVAHAGECRLPRRSLAVLPLEHEFDALGVLVLETQTTRLSPDDLQTLRLLAALAAGSLAARTEFDRAAQRARTDALTGLPNRRHFEEQLRQHGALAERYGQPLSLVMLDVDHFKRVNDTWGHDAGDAVLRAVADILRRSVREVDSCGRLGGEELAVLLPNTDAAGARELAERVRVGLEETRIAVAGSEIRVTASLGVATFPRPVRRPAELMKAADSELYRAKAGGRNRVRVAGIESACDL